MTAAPALFHESINEALREIALVYGAGKLKVAGAELRPDLTPEDAGKWLSDCLNSDRAQELKPGQVMWFLRIGRKIGCHAAMNFIARDAGYADPAPIEPEDERARLQRDFIAAAKSMQAIADQLARNGLKVA